MTKPLVSVIIPALNAGEYLAEALESVLRQTYKPIEIIVVDDGSQDATADVAARYGSGVRYFYQKNAGAAAARNSGVEKARGDLLAFLDADDIWLDYKLSHQYELLTGGTGIDMVFGLVLEFISPELTTAEAKKIVVSASPVPGYVFGTLLIRKEAFFATGLISEKWKAGEFIDWYLRAVNQGLRGELLQEEVMKRRIHANNMMRGGRALQQDYVHILKLNLDRRRGRTREK